MEPHLETNRRLWDAFTPVHARSAFYDVPAFLDGGSTLKEIELQELGDVRGKSLLHLQCHIGLDSLSWARRGARVTGVDFSAPAVDLARALAKQAGLGAEFLCAGVYDLPENLAAAFDIVFASYGVFSWLPDLRGWASAAARCLKPGGVLYVVEFHPIVEMLGDDGTRIERSYFAAAEPQAERARGSYADPGADIHLPYYTWAHGLGEITSAVIDAGLRLEFLHEFPFSPWNCFPFLEETAPGRFEVRGLPGRVPLVFSLRAVRG